MLGVTFFVRLLITVENNIVYEKMVYTMRLGEFCVHYKNIQLIFIQNKFLGSSFAYGDEWSWFSFNGDSCNSQRMHVGMPRRDSLSLVQPCALSLIVLVRSGKGQDLEPHSRLHFVSCCGHEHYQNLLLRQRTESKFCVFDYLSRMNQIFRTS